jgi:hypothetical protein
VEKIRSIPAKRVVEQNLPGSAFEQIGTADDFGDFHVMIVYDDGKLVAGNIVMPPQHEVAKV